MNIKKSLVNTAVISVLTGVLAAPAQAQMLDFSFEGLFTITNGSGAPTQNTSYPYYGDTTWGYGNRTQISGALSFDTITGAGTGTIYPFEFFASGPAVFHDVNFQAVGDGFGGPGSLVIGNMILDWNASSNYSVEIVLDASGLFGAIQSGMNYGDTVSGVGALPATDGMRKGTLPIGPVPIATSTLDTDGVTITGDDGVGGSAMDNGPFVGFNINLDMTSITQTTTCAFPADSYAVTSCTPPPPIPVPAAIWLFGSGLVGLFGVARCRKQV